MSCGLESLKRDSETVNTKEDTRTTTAIIGFVIGTKKSKKIGTIRIEMIRNVMNDLVTNSKRLLE